ncbi:MAG: REP-associated tyrosine transposase [Roseibacillus sp.]
MDILVGPVTDQRSKKGWHSRGYLPHFDGTATIQALTFRLADSLPQSVLAGWRTQLRDLDEAQAHIQLSRKIAHYEDAGHGACLLSNPSNAEIVQDALLHFDGERYRLLDWVIMPNHVHALVKTDTEPLPRIVKSWKTFTARQINLARKSSGPVWEREYHDRYIRDLAHYHNAVAYIRNNPVKAKLCPTPRDWPYSSASAKT